MKNNWNPWHGCKKISPGCKHCYVYRQDKMHNIQVDSSHVRKNVTSFDLPLQKKRNKSYKLPAGNLVYTCLTSDFFIEEADEWRTQAWAMIEQRQDLYFFIFTKRIDRFLVSLPNNWGKGYKNVIIACSVENQKMADIRLPILTELPILHRVIIVAPILEQINIQSYLDNKIEEVAVSGESGAEARVCDYNWILDIRRQCIEKGVPFCFHQTGAKLLKDGKLYRIKRCNQISQAHKANIDYKLHHNFKIYIENNEENVLTLF